MSVKVVLTPWVNHDGGAIYSLDVSPTEYKIATCGNGEGGDGLIVIWSLLPMVSEKHGRNVETRSPLLARITTTRGVNSVRWSRCGKYFAAASDDKTVSVWEFGGRIKSAGTIGMRKEETSMEKYRCVHSMHGHSMEVLSVEWSWDGRFLASASIDHTVIVWNALKLPERLVVLDDARDGHTGSVKGLSFDPIGKYLATQSDDKTLRVWSMENWVCERKIAEPFEESAQTTMFMRPEWSPDGKILAAPCAMNNGGPTAQLIMRSNWDTQRDLVGNRKAVTVVRCAPRCFEYEDYKGKMHTISLFAVGSRDKSLSVWGLPGLNRPLVVFSNFFKHSVMDATWKDTTLFCCSQDGSVKTIIFDEKAVGRMYRQQEMSNLCFDLYRTRPSQYNQRENGEEGGGGGGSVNGSPTKGAFIETAADLAASRLVGQTKDTQKEAAAREKEEAEKRARVEAELLEKRKEQVENRTKDGKRRIQPVFLCSTIDNSVPENEIPDDILVAERAEAGPAAAAAKKKLNQPTTKSMPAPAKDVRMAASTASEESEESSSESESGSCSSDESSSAVHERAEEGEERGEGRAVKRRRKMGERERLLLADFRRPVLRPLETLQKDSLTLAAAELQQQLVQPIGGAKQWFIVADNTWSTNGGVRATRVTRAKSGENGSHPTGDESRDRVKWTTFLASPVLVITANTKWSVLTCADCSLHVLSADTGALLFTLQLDSLPAQLGMQDNKAYVLTSNGYFSCWDLTAKKAIFSRIPMMDIVANDVHLHSISLSPSGAPLISFTNGSSYCYSTDLASWFAIDLCSSLSRLSGEAMAGEDVGGGAIARVIRGKKRPGMAPETSLSTRAWCGQMQMETWMFAALDAHSMDDLRPMVARYTDMLIMTTSKGKLRDLLSTLDGWVERARRKERGDEWMDGGRMEAVREMVRQSIASDVRVAGVLKEREEDGQMIF